MCTTGTQKLRNDKGSTINVCSLPCKLFAREALFYQWEDNI